MSLTGCKIITEMKTKIKYVVRISSKTGQLFHVNFIVMVWEWRCVCVGGGGGETDRHRHR